MLAALTLAAHLTAASVPLPNEQVVSSKEMITAPRPTGRAARLLLQGGAGMAAGLLLGLITMETGVVQYVPYDEFYPTRPSLSVEGLRAGFGLGAGLGVYSAGYALDGDGSLIGMGLGMGLGATTALLLSMFVPDLGGVASVTLPLAGAVAGYELGSADANTSLKLRPSFTVNKAGLELGFTGNF
jgi:hypothetical protein